MQEFEVIVVNDGSTDASADLVSAAPTAAFDWFISIIPDRGRREIVELPR